LNSQLLNQRELNQKLTQSFNEYEAAQSLILSQKNTRIIQLETENKAKNGIIAGLVTALVLMALWIMVSRRLK
jgi:hypothetical protein